MAYFYISANDRETCNVTNLIRSLVAQLFGCRPDTPKSLTDLGTCFDTSGVPSQNMLEDALQSAVQDFTATYIVIDGLDECPDSKHHGSGPSQRRVLLSLLETMHGWKLANLHILVTSRREQDINNALQSLITHAQTQAQALDMADHCTTDVTSDIGLFIDEELKRGIFQRLTEDLKSQIKTGIIDKCNGV